MSSKTFPCPPPDGGAGGVAIKGGRDSVPQVAAAQPLPPMPLTFAASRRYRRASQEEGRKGEWPSPPSCARLVLLKKL